MTPPTCDRCLYIADFLIHIKRQPGDQEVVSEYWCWSCVSGQDDE